MINIFEPVSSKNESWSRISLGIEGMSGPILTMGQKKMLIFCEKVIFKKNMGSMNGWV